ncbi:MAG: serine/threonine protein kinase [Candidatus Kerfeldbacteria bacterium]|nr:serine/threonine protein kinase [Candidatus Kerfeldbacteria bacterium]
MQNASPRFTQLKPRNTTKYNVIIQALDTTTQKKIIIKTPRVDFVTDSSVCANLAHETEVLMSVNTLPHVQRYITHGVENDHGHAIPYLVTELAAGKTLYDIVRDEHHNGRFAHREGIILMRAIAETLFPVHELGLIHCDLKLGNVLWDVAGSQCTVMDWAASVNIATQQRTTSDIVIGTAQFMSYEHVLGLPLDARTDIYALGIIVTLLVYGQELTPRYTLVDGKMTKRSKEETSEAVSKKETIKTELFDLPASSYDWSLQQLLKRMTHWDREQRPNSMHEIVQECEKILN